MVANNDGTKERRDGVVGGAVLDRVILRVLATLP
jgi:hypothetical protein